MEYSIDDLKEVLTLEEINKIVDLGLREIRIKYWHMRHKIFLDEKSIPDNELEEEFEKISNKEKIEIEKYFNDNHIEITKK